MKIRNGFVSNSSSSSFILKFDEKPTSKEHLKKILFGDNVPETITYSYDTIDVDDVINKLYNDLNLEYTSILTTDIFQDCDTKEYNIILGIFNNNDPLGVSILISEINTIDTNISDLYKGLRYSEDSDNINSKIDSFYETREQYKNRINNILLQYFVEKYSNNVFVKYLEYSDNGYGIISYILERSNVLEPVTFIKISMH